MGNFTWLPIAIFSYSLSAINATVDRAIIHREHTEPIIVSFWVSLFSLLTAGLILVGFLPFDFAVNFKFQTSSIGIMSLAVLSGFWGQSALLFLYRALKYGEVTRVSSVIGGLAPIISLTLAYVFLGERLASGAIAGFAILLISTLILTYEPKKIHSKSHYKWIINVIAASIILGSQAVLAKYVYNNYHFISAYSFTGVGAGLYLITIILLSKNVKKELASIFKKSSSLKKRSTIQAPLLLVIGNSIIGGIAIILINFAIKLGSPALVGSLRGVQYAGIFILSYAVSRYYPKLLSEDTTKKSETVKISGLAMTVIGILVLTLSTK